MISNDLTKTFFESSEFEFTANLEYDWLVIRQELEELLKLQFDSTNQTTTKLDMPPLDGNERLTPPGLSQVDIQQGRFVPWPEKFIYDTGWEVFGLYAYGYKLNENCQLCPKTTSLLEKIPGIMTAGFSSLAPGTHIHPHIGYTKEILRCHLGLIVPNECTLRVDTETRHWQEGKCLIFDDTFEHEAWNKSDRTRIVLLIDFKRPKSTLNDQA